MVEKSFGCDVDFAPCDALATCVSIDDLSLK